MGLLITSTTQALRHGAYIIEQQPPLVITPTGTGVACIVEQFPWGPIQTLTTPTSVADRLNTFCPPGFDRTSEGYLAMSQKAYPILKVVRVGDTAAVAASATLTNSVPTNLVTLTLKYGGTAGNSVTWTTSAPSDGVSGHYNLAVSITGASGTTTDTLRNLTGTTADTNLSLQNTLLLGSLNVLTAGTPTFTSGSFSSGTDGTITAASYVGTQGTGDKGLALLEADKTIRHVFFGDPGNTFRATANAGMMNHVNFMGDRMGYINGNSGQSLTAAQTDVGNYRSIFVVYCDPWCYMDDDVDGTKRLTVTAPYAASLGANLSPSTSIAWKSPEATQFLGSIVQLEFDRGEATSTNTDAGIATFIKEDLGGFSIEAGVNTEAPVVPAKKSDTRSRMLAYIGRSLTSSVRSVIDGPNVVDNQQTIIEAVDRFLDGLVKNSKTDPNHSPHILAYDVSDPSVANTDSSLAAGEFTVPLSVQLSAAMSKLFFLLNIGESVTVRSLG